MMTTADELETRDVDTTGPGLARLLDRVAADPQARVEVLHD